jgi:8-amino-7-oxononanoate synthase
MRGDEWAARELEKLKARGLYRMLRPCAAEMPGGERRILDFASNDYLNLARDPRLAEAARAALAAGGTGAGASRLLSGSRAIHGELERELAAHKGYPAALVFGSGFLTNVGVVPALVGRGDHVLIDRLSHASIIDGARLSGASVTWFCHNDPRHLEELLRALPRGAHALVVTESVFSMDGDLAPLADLAAVAGRAGAMFMVDEAHATGVFGPRGSGRVPELGLQEAVAVCMGTLSKALGAYGGFVACSAAMREYLINTARSFIFTTALPPAVAASALAALRILTSEPGLGAALRERAAHLRDRLREGGLNTGASVGPIIPLIVGGNEKTLAFSERLRSSGIVAPAIRPPTVPAGTERLRLSVTLAHTEGDVDRAADAIREAARAEGIG